CESRAHAAALGLLSSDKKQAAAPRRAWEHFAVGRAHFQNGNLEQAAAQFDQALVLQPQSFWPNFFKGKCAYYLERYEDAVLAFTACVALAPGNAWCFSNRGRAHVARGQSDRALDDYDRALRVDPALA